MMSQEMERILAYTQAQTVSDHELEGVVGGSTRGALHGTWDQHGKCTDFSGDLIFER